MTRVTTLAYASSCHFASFSGVTQRANPWHYVCLRKLMPLTKEEEMSQNQKTVVMQHLENLYNEVINNAQSKKKLMLAHIRFEAGVNAVKKGHIKVARGAFVALRKLK